MTITKQVPGPALATSSNDAITDQPKLHPLTIEQVASLPHIHNLAVSPDGCQLAYSQHRYCTTRNKHSRNLCLVDISGNTSNGKRTVIHLTDSSIFDAIDDNPFWIDDRTVGFLSARSGYCQLWTATLPRDRSRLVDQNGSCHIKQLSHWLGNILTAQYHRATRTLVFSAMIYKERGLNDTTHMIRVMPLQAKDSGVVYDRLYVRQWDRYIDGRRQKLFAIRVKQSLLYGYQIDGEPIDLMANYDSLECPSYPFGSLQDYTISPDGKEVAFVAKVSALDQAWSTQSDIYVVSLDETTRIRKLTIDNRGACSKPVYSPDGKQLAWLQMLHHGYESDCNRIMLMTRHEHTNNGGGRNHQLPVRLKRQINVEWDRSPLELVWTTDSRSLLVTADHLGSRCIFRINARSGDVQQLTRCGYSEGITIIDEHRLLFLQSRSTQPTELYVLHFNDIELDDTIKLQSPMSSVYIEQITHMNKQIMKTTALSEFEGFWFTGANDDRVHGWLVRPFDFNATQQYPVVLLIHGGPQGAWSDNFHYRWNANLFAANGFAVVAINPHGSTGYGQRFTDSIQNQWGGWAYDDLMTGLDYALDCYPFLDVDRMCAIGASYGGYMVNWINGHTHRFRCLVSQAGIFNTLMSYYHTDELFFPSMSLVDFLGTIRRIIRDGPLTIMLLNGEHRHLSFTEEKIIVSISVIV
ncbi:hypothetical protein BDF22DRAFT_672848, partial [Syncephalis plumigaleata]